MKVDKASRTALTICLSQFVLQSHEPFKSLVTSEQIKVATEVTKHFHPILFPILNILRPFKFFIRLLGRLQSKRAVAGLSSFWVVRKKAIFDAVDELLQKESEIQVVALAAGFDTLTYRLSKKYPNVEFFETDHPATQKVKIFIYAILRFFTKNNHLVPCDYTKTRVENVLAKQPRFDQNKRTIFIAEGLMMYLPHDVYLKMLASMKDFINADSYMIFSYLQNRPNGKPGFLQQSPKLDPWLAKHGEPFMWGQSPMQLEAEMLNEGYEVLIHVNHETLKRNYFKDLEIQFAEGENIAMVANNKFNVVKNAADSKFKSEFSPPSSSPLLKGQEIFGP